MCTRCDVDVRQIASSPLACTGARLDQGNQFLSSRGQGMQKIQRKAGESLKLPLYQSCRHYCFSRQPNIVVFVLVRTRSHRGQNHLKFRRRSTSRHLHTQTRNALSVLQSSTSDACAAEPARAAGCPESGGRSRRRAAASRAARMTKDPGRGPCELRAERDRAEEGFSR